MSYTFPDSLKTELSSFDILDGQKIEQDDSQLVLAEEYLQQIQIYHIPTDTTIKFKAFLNDYSDQFQSEWQNEQAYGRMDPIVQFQGTSRVISLDWTLPSFSREEAKLNQRKCDTLFRMLYPMYEAAGMNNALSITTAPLFRVLFGNLIIDSSVASPTMGSHDIGTAREQGLVGTISGFTYAPDLDQGMHNDKNVADSGHGPVGLGLMFPKATKLSMEYTVLHTYRPGKLPFYVGANGTSFPESNANTAGFGNSAASPAQAGSSGTWDNRVDAKRQQNASDMTEVEEAQGASMEGEGSNMPWQG